MPDSSPAPKRWIPALISAIALLLIAPLALLAGGLLGNHLPLTDPPGLGTRLSTYFNTNVAATSPDSPFPELRPRSFPVPPGQLFEQVQQAVQRLGWEIVQADPQAGTLTAIVTTPLWHFQDDVSIQVQPGPSASSSELNIRSASRVGQGDLGTNTRHVLDLNQALAAPSQT